MNAPEKYVSQLLGAITGLHGDVLQGWAMDPQNPQLRLAVEIYIDHIFVALVRADMEQPLDAPGDGFHGFAVQLRPAWLENAEHVTARIANHGPWLDGALALADAGKRSAPAPIATQAWYTGGLKIKGWAWDPDAPSRHVTVQAREGLRQLVTATANQPHPALIGRSTADHGFDIDLPWELADGQAHEIHLETDHGTPLTGSPIRLCLHPEGFAALLHRLWPAQERENGQTASVPALLSQLAKTQDIHFPRSAGFNHYPRWHAVFQQPQAYRQTPGVAVVVLLGEGSEADEATSRLSIQKQRLPAEQVQVIAPAAGELLDELARHVATAAIIVPLQRGDRLASHALDTLLTLLGESGAGWAYADCDQDDSTGGRSNPWFKPGWDETLFYGADIVTPGAALTGAAVSRAMAGLAQAGLAGKAGWHWLLAGVVASNQAPVMHIPQVLYQRRANAPTSPHLALPDSQRHAAINWLAQQRAPGASVQANPQYPGLSRVNWPLPAELPLISLIVPTRDQLKLLRTCIDGLLDSTDYPALEIIIVDNGSCIPETLAYLQHIQGRGVRVLPYPHAFNYAAINNWAAERAKGRIIGLVNNDIEILHPDWLKEMLTQLLRPGIGAVGAKLMWPNGMVQHGGVVVGINGLAAHTGNNLNRDDAGYLGFNHLAREQSVVTTACLLMRKRDYLRLGGMDEKRFTVTFNDVDMCLRLRETGQRLVWTPFANLVHAESASRGKEDTPTKAARAGREQQHFIARWSQAGQQDPYYHPCLSTDYLAGPYGGLALPPRSSAPRCTQQNQKNAE
ncbi:glycosyltransferase family 2 protein [Stutzerimonas stutzeri]|uniref:glycosyltransferase family 2 protein n=1 Tax=Stutzerimonas stutzeri TaxID=316 RepID=UPI00210DC565|nr:glycosyltransferase family 2 protein [Stutzerimonas stutzeri]MCQ4321754.1 glycosyltransferase family 2 protein [Stutzerimonas stutzeri]